MDTDFYRLYNSFIKGYIDIGEFTNAVRKSKSIRHKINEILEPYKDKEYELFYYSFDYDRLDEPEGVCLDNNSFLILNCFADMVTCIIIGKLRKMEQLPHPKEIYICHSESYLNNCFFETVMKLKYLNYILLLFFHYQF